MENSRRRKRGLGGLLFLLIFIIGVLFAARGYYSYLQSPLDKNGEMKAFVVQKGEGADSVAERLEKEKFIKSAWVFKLAYKTSENPRIEAGDFKLSASMSLDEIIKTLKQGSVDKWVTLLEGWRVEEVAAKLNKELGVDEKEFISKAKKYEGHLFPDTYLINPKASVEDIISLLNNTFESKYSDELQAKVKAQGLTAEQGVILASLVEREGRSDKVRTEVASILLKRFKMGMKLDVDATVQYAMGFDGKTWWRTVLLEDYKFNSNYNTYLNNGFPPGPICNPSLSSLNAVSDANPNTPYIYYFHNVKGESYYAKTLDEHNANVAKYR